MASLATFSSCIVRIPEVQVGQVYALGASSPRVLLRKSVVASCAVAEARTLERVRTVIASQLSVDESTVTPEAKFSDLGADSLDTVEIMMNLEESFKISLGEEGAEKIATVQDAANLIQEVVSKNQQ